MSTEGHWSDSSTVATLICCLLDPKSLAVARAVNKAWQQVATDPQVRRAAFIHHWQLLGCHGQPRHLPFFETAALTSFAREHLVQRTDTLQMLAVRHGITVPCLKRVNNLMSDHSLHSRTHLYIPAASQQDLAGQLVCFKHCPIIKRDFAVLMSPQHSSHQHQLQDSLEHQQHHTDDGSNNQPSTASKIDVLQARLCQMLGRSLYVDDSTAKFYLEDANGDVKAAMEAFAQDVAWEGTTAGPIRTAPVQKWIRGELGM